MQPTPDEVSMQPTPDEFRQRLLIDVMLLRDYHDRIWKIFQSLPLGEVKNSLEMAHQAANHLIVNLRKTLMEMA
jgi:hypothetical protein